MYTNTYPHTGSVVARDNKDRADQPETPLTVKNMLGAQKPQKQQKQLTDLQLGSWNVRTLLDREGSNRPERRSALVARELAKYNIDIAALSETRFSDTGSMVDLGYTFFWSGRPEGEKREAGVAFAVNNELLPIMTETPKSINDRIMTMRLPLRKNNHVTLLSVYAPTMTNSDEIKDEFYNQLSCLLQTIPKKDKLIVMGDFNARVGQDWDKWPDVMGKHGIGTCNPNGELLLALCTEFNLTITNTLFKQKIERKTTWMHPRSKHWHMIDYIITRQTDKMDFHITRAMRGANCSTDHQLLRAKVALNIRVKHRKNGCSKPTKLNTQKLANFSNIEILQHEIDEVLGKKSFQVESTLDEDWQSLSNTVYNIANKVLGTPERKHQDWFDQNDQHLRDLLDRRDQTHQLTLQPRATRSSTTAYKHARATLQRYTRKLKTDWWEQKAKDLQRAADTNDMRGFYSQLKEVWGPQKRGATTLKSADGMELITDKRKVDERWREHFEQLLNVPGSIQPEALSRIQQHSEITELNDEPSLVELMNAVKILSEGKAPGPDGIPAEIWKCGGEKLIDQLHKIILRAWQEENVPQEWKDANLVTIFKKGDRTECGNYRGISLLSIAGKAFARILLNRLEKHVTHQIIPETQCGFRSNRSTIDMIFCLRQLQEKCVEQDKSLYVVFVDFTKAFDTVGRSGLWHLLRKYGCPERFTNMIQALHTGMNAKVQSTEETVSFPVTNGVKQGCVLAPTLFSLFLSAVLEEAFKDINKGVYIQSRADANLFNVSHFRAKTKTTRILVRELLFADDSALLAHSAADIQAITDAFSSASKKFGLKINIKKTEALYQASSHAPSLGEPIKVDDAELTSVHDFTYLGSTISKDGRLDVELQKRMAKASSAFGRLQSRLWNNHHVSMRTKCNIYRAVVVSTLLYGAESWTLYRSQVKKLHAFMMRHLRKIMGIKWQDKITNVAVLERANIPSMEDLLIRKNLRWTGHILRLNSERLPLQVLYSQLSSGTRKRGRPRLRFKDTVKRNLKQRNIDPNQLGMLCKERSTWRGLVK